MRTLLEEAFRLNANDLDEDLEDYTYSTEEKNLTYFTGKLEDLYKILTSKKILPSSNGYISFSNLYDNKGLPSQIRKRPMGTSKRSSWSYGIAFDTDVSDWIKNRSKQYSKFTSMGKGLDIEGKKLKSKKNFLGLTVSRILKGKYHGNNIYVLWLNHYYLPILIDEDIYTKIKNNLEYEFKLDSKNINHITDKYLKARISKARGESKYNLTKDQEAKFKNGQKLGMIDKFGSVNKNYVLDSNNDGNIEGLKPSLIHKIKGDPDFEKNLEGKATRIKQFLSEANIEPEEYYYLPKEYDTIQLGEIGLTNRDLFLTSSRTFIPLTSEQIELLSKSFGVDEGEFIYKDEKSKPNSPYYFDSLDIIKFIYIPKKVKIENKIYKSQDILTQNKEDLNGELLYLYLTTELCHENNLKIFYY